jgi:hypothetical protein
MRGHSLTGAIRGTDAVVGGVPTQNYPLLEDPCNQMLQITLSGERGKRETTWPANQFPWPIPISDVSDVVDGEADTSQRLRRRQRQIKSQIDQWTDFRSKCKKSQKRHNGSSEQCAAAIRGRGSKKLQPGSLDKPCRAQPVSVPLARGSEPTAAMARPVSATKHIVGTPVIHGARVCRKQTALQLRKKDSCVHCIMSSVIRPGEGIFGESTAVVGRTE